MANNLVEYLAQLKAKDPKRANWLFDCSNVGTNTFGFIKPKLVKEVIAGSHVTYDFKSAYSSNPTISPVLSRAKVSVCAIWIPVSLYVPALRDGVQVKAGKDDYSFPSITFDYHNLRLDYINAVTNAQSDLSAESQIKIYDAIFGKGMPYIPSNSIFTELGMWRPNFTPVSFGTTNPDSAVPEPKNAIPLLGYYDFYRSYILNSQTEFCPLRTQGYNVQLVKDENNHFVKSVQEPNDSFISRVRFDNLFRQVRERGTYYFNNGQPFDVSDKFASFYFSNLSNTFAPGRKILQERVDPGLGFLVSQPILFNDDHFGELRATYFADYNTAFLSNENVQYERSTARVATDDDGIITMEQIYHAQKVQNFIRRTVFKNSDYADFIDAQYGITPPTNLTKPLFLGKVSTWLSFNDVISQAQTSDDTDVDSNTSLGSRSSLGFGRMVTGKLRDKDDRHFVSFTAKEPGYFMVLEWIVPEVSYFQGFDPLYDKRSLGSLFFPAFDRDGYQDKHFKYLNEQLVNNVYGPAGLPPFFSFENYNVAVSQEPAWWEYMTTYNKMSGQMVDSGVYRHWVFHREFDPLHIQHSRLTDDTIREYDPTQQADWAEPPQNITNNIYVTPEDYTHIFANEQGLDNFQTFYKHELKIYQPLSHRFLSF